MNDRELLELAAKAAGIGIVDWHENDPTIWDDVEPCAWNPLTDDGDALRLAVKLNMYVMRFDVMTTARSSAATCDERDDGDPYAATRRAIVRAAAEIGKASSNAK